MGLKNKIAGFGGSVVCLSFSFKAVFIKQVNNFFLDKLFFHIEFFLTFKSGKDEVYNTK